MVNTMETNEILELKKEATQLKETIKAMEERPLKRREITPEIGQGKPHYTHDDDYPHKEKRIEQGPVEEEDLRCIDAYLEETKPWETKTKIIEEINNYILK